MNKDSLPDKQQRAFYFDRIRGGKVMAEGIIVHAENLEEATEKADRLSDWGDEIRHRHHAGLLTPDDAEFGMSDHAATPRTDAVNKAWHAVGDKGQAFADLARQLERELADEREWREKLQDARDRAVDAIPLKAFPREPTNEMCAAAQKSEHGKALGSMGWGHYAAVWRAMYDAAPVNEKLATPSHVRPRTGPLNLGHGHVWPRPDGVKARCGGPGLCDECSADAAQAKAATPSATATTKKEDWWELANQHAETNLRFSQAVFDAAVEGKDSQEFYISIGRILYLREIVERHEPEALRKSSWHFEPTKRSVATDGGVE